jgi:hypothetical protein
MFRRIEWNLTACIFCAIVCAIATLSACSSGPAPSIPDNTNHQDHSSSNDPSVNFDPGSSPNNVTGITLQSVDMNTPGKPVAQTGPVNLAAAQNEWISFALQVRNLPRPNNQAVFTLRFQPLKIGTTGQGIDAAAFTIYQVLSMPVDTDKAGYVRQTGLPTGPRDLPRALLPVPTDRGAINVSALRDPAKPFDPNSRAGAESSQPPVVWVDIHVPTIARPGIYTGTCDLLVSGQSLPISQLQVSMQVYDFAIPQERHLQMVSQISWEDLDRLYTNAFEAITPRLMNRHDPTYAPPIHVLDQLVSLAEENRTSVIVPRLQPTVKWPPSALPVVTWDDFDTVVTPWLSGKGFADKTPLGYWPLPAPDYLENYDEKSQVDYWSSAATHFNQNDWLDRSAVLINQKTPGRVEPLEALQISLEAQRILAAHPLVRVTLPLEDDQLSFASAQNPQLIDPKTSPRLMTAATGLVFAPPTQAWPGGVALPQHWLRTDLAGLVPYVGAGGDERDVRLWAWLAYLKRAQMIMWTDALPRQNQPTEQADPNEMVWFYPGQWFGVDQPVPSIQLKWLRRAQQDYEYLYLATQRGMPANALMLARLMTKQVQIQPGQTPDPEFGLFTGTVDQKTWDEAQTLLARTISLRGPGKAPPAPGVQSPEDVALNLDTIRWQAPKEQPFIIPRKVQWLWEDATHANGNNNVYLWLGVDIYNAGDNRPDQNRLQWTGAGDGWIFTPQPVLVDALQTYWVQRYSLQAKVDLNRVTPDSRKPLDINFIDGYTHNEYHAQAELPVAASDRREGRLVIDGKLDDWSAGDLIHDGKLVKMMDRPSVQGRTIAPASQTSQIYTGWADENFYLAFRLNGISHAEQPHRNFVDFQFRRAWGEDLCEVLVQPIYDDNTVGPLTYIACKPNGVAMVKRRLDPRVNLEPWQDIDGTAVRYACDPDHGPWTGEVAIPWQLLQDPGRTTIPKLLRFNVIQHLAANGESDSWAGPIDFDRDDGYMGLLYLRERPAPGMKDAGN